MVLENNKKRFISKSNIFKELAPYLNLGLQIALSVCLGALFGWWLDKLLDTKPILLIVFSFVGIVAGFYSFFNTISQLEKKKKQKK